MASAPNDVKAYQARRIEKEAIYLVSSVSAVLEAISNDDVEQAASVQEVIEAIDEVHKIYDDLCRVTANWEDDNWNQAASASVAKRFSFGPWSKMTALQASFSAGRLIVDECATHLPRHEKSSRDDLAKFATEVGRFLKDETLQAIEEQLRKEWRVVSGLLPDYAHEWEKLENNERNFVLAVFRLHKKCRRQKTFTMDEIKTEAEAPVDDESTYVGPHTLPKISCEVQLTGFLVKVRRQFMVPQSARDWLQNFLADAEAGPEPRMQ
jgi:hypothetical protein